MITVKLKDDQQPATYSNFKLILAYSYILNGHWPLAWSSVRWSMHHSLSFLGLEEGKTSLSDTSFLRYCDSGSNPKWSQWAVFGNTSFDIIQREYVHWISCYEKISSNRYHIVQIYRNIGSRSELWNIDGTGKHWTSWIRNTEAPAPASCKVTCPSMI